MYSNIHMCSVVVNAYIKYLRIQSLEQHVTEFDENIIFFFFWFIFLESTDLSKHI